MRVEPSLGEKDKSGYSNRAMKDVSNMGFSVAELGLENMKGVQDEQREIEEGVDLVVDLDFQMGNSKKSGGGTRLQVLLIAKKKKRDRALRKQKGKGIVCREEVVVNASISDSDIINRKRVILKEARNAWEVGKKLGLNVRGDEREVVDEIMKLEQRVDLCFIQEPKPVMGNSGGAITIWDMFRFQAGQCMKTAYFWKAIGGFGLRNVTLALENEAGCGGVLRDDKEVVCMLLSRKTGDSKSEMTEIFGRVRRRMDVDCGTNQLAQFQFKDIRKQSNGMVNALAKAGRNARGIITARHRGGGHKRLYRKIDF
ncbi:hypothetical protein J1N35_029442 [Gossypium stocksii]|uniref:Large ribosomal subunit protein uL2 RNA-binding domain-containing protein n=1 Tax=Gossypium stocksii TaxID=47602 RepID=A0A9D3UXL9_9ROSI|nr:hypothetical protein J1N35_029442 [Gossypium stocksii]